MLGDMQVHLALEYTLHIALAIVVHGRLSVAPSAEVSPKGAVGILQWSSSPNILICRPLLQNSPQGLEHFCDKMRNDDEKGSLPSLLLDLRLFLLL